MNFTEGLLGSPDAATSEPTTDVLDGVSVTGSPRRGLAGATFGFFNGFAGVVSYPRVNSWACQ